MTTFRMADNKHCLAVGPLKEDHQFRDMVSENLDKVAERDRCNNDELGSEQMMLDDSQP